MRKALFLLVLVSFMACNSNKNTKVKSMSTKDSTVAQKIVYPPVDNSTNFEIGDGSVIPGMLEVYKAWEENDMATMKKHFADTVLLVGSDGTELHGSRDSAILRVQVYRNMYTTLKNNYHAFVNLRSVDKNENWLVVWYKQHMTDKKGKVDQAEFIENWRLNKDGNIEALYKYIQHSPATPNK